jgi:hypothetical protein
MGHDSERAAMIYQHEARGADATITSAIDAHIVTEQGQGDDDDDSSGALVPLANCTLIARKINNSQAEAKLQTRDSGPELGGNMWSG